MTKRTNISRLKYSTIVLVAVAALMGSAHIAKAKGDHHQGNNSQGNGARPHFVISGQPANVKRVLRTNKRKRWQKEEKGLRKYHCSDGRVRSESQKSCRQYTSCSSSITG